MANNYDQATVQPDFPNSSFTEFEYLLFIQFELAKWSIHELETSFASKYYQTAVGPKQADLFFSNLIGNHYINYRLSIGVKVVMFFQPARYLFLSKRLLILIFQIWLLPLLKTLKQEYRLVTQGNYFLLIAILSLPLFLNGNMMRLM